MGENSSDFRDALVELVEATHPEPADHPSPEQWIAYHRGELAAEEEARFQEHLVRCRDCFDLAQAADAFARPDEEPDAGEAQAADALWRQLSPQLAPAAGRPPDAPGAQVPRVQSIAGRRPARSGWFRPASLLAASLLVALAGMTAWSLHLQGLVAALRAPRPDVTIVEFAGGERPAGAEEKSVAAGSGPWLLMFFPAQELPLYRLTVRDATSGRQVLAEVLRPDADGALTLHLPEELAAGRYRLELADGAGERAGEVLQTDLLIVTEESGGS